MIFEGSGELLAEAEANGLIEWTNNINTRSVDLGTICSVYCSSLLVLACFWRAFLCDPGNAKKGIKIKVWYYFCPQWSLELCLNSFLINGSKHQICVVFAHGMNNMYLYIDSHSSISLVQIIFAVFIFNPPTTCISHHKTSLSYQCPCIMPYQHRCWHGSMRMDGLVERKGHWRHSGHERNHKSCSIGYPPHSSASPVELRLRVGPRVLSGGKK